MSPYLLIIAAFFIAFGSVHAPVSTLSNDPAVIIMLTLVALCLAPVPAALFARWVRLKTFSSTLHLHGRAYSILRVASSLFILADFAAITFLFGWGSLVEGSLGLAHFVTYDRLVWFPPIALLLLFDDFLKFLPFLVMLFMIWVPLYRVELLIRHATWGLADYVRFNLRHYVLFLLVPLGMLLLIEDVLSVLPRSLLHRLDASNASYVLGALFIIAILLALPLLLRFVWKTRPLPPGPLRARLEDLLVRTRLRCRQILLWDTFGGQMVNACVTGFVRFTRYILVTDSLIDSLSPDEVVAVFAHEIAHVKRHHLVFYLMFALGFVPFAFLPPLLLPPSSQDVLYQSIWLLIAMLLYWGLGFGYLSRRMELEADLYAASLCGGVFDLVNALEKIVQASGRSRTGRSWRHFSIARRVDLLAATVADPSLLPRFHRRFLLLKVACVLLAVGAIVAFILYPALLKELF